MFFFSCILPEFLSAQAHADKPQPHLSSKVLNHSVLRSIVLGDFFLNFAVAGSFDETLAASVRGCHVEARLYITQKSRGPEICFQVERELLFSPFREGTAGWGAGSKQRSGNPCCSLNRPFNSLSGPRGWASCLPGTYLSGLMWAVL